MVADGTTGCVASGCRITSCVTGFDDCDKQIADGCEVNTTNDVANCGACGNKCAAGSSCLAGVCQAVNCQMTGCPGGTTCCGTLCINTATDLANCGNCGNKCAAGANLCQSGACCFPQTGGGEVCGSIVCAAPLQACNNVCVDESTDPGNCGFCGNTCAAGSTCVNGMCSTTTTCNGGPACSPAQSCCKTGCSDTLTDSQNCGGRGRPVPARQQLLGGSCSKTCNGGPVCTGALQCCTSGCTDTTSSVTNCGSCGFTCPAGDVCVGGACQATCNGGPTCTGAEACCKTGCSDLTTDTQNCGKCGLACGAGQTRVREHARRPCSATGGPACSAGQTCCSAGCATTSTDSNNCGKCGNVCPATAACVGGTCVASEGAYNPTENPSILTPGVHNFTTVNIPTGVTVQVEGGGAASGTLDSHATGAIVIDGIIDLSGGPGTQNSVSSMNTQLGRAGSGGYTGEPTSSAPASASCAWVAGNPGLRGFAIQGSTGNCTVLTTCILSQTDPNAPLLFTSPWVAYGGGAGVFTGYRAYGSGGGGIAGGAPGALCAAYPGEQDCSGVSGGGGAVDGQGGQAGIAVYNGAAGTSGSSECPGSQAGVPPACVGGGGGGSIGAKAVADSRP